MPKDKLSYLGNCIRQARNDCNLTQQDLADQSHVAIKTIQMIEKGKINPSYEILYPLIKRLGISANTLFNPEISDADEEIQRFIGKFQACIPENRKILLNTLDYLAEQLLTLQHNPSENLEQNQQCKDSSYYCWFLLLYIPFSKSFRLQFLHNLSHNQTYIINFICVLSAQNFFNFGIILKELFAIFCILSFQLKNLSIIYSFFNCCFHFFKTL